MFHISVNIGRTNIELYVFEIFLYGQDFPKYECRDLGAVYKFRLCIFSLQTFNILTLHLILTIFVIGSMHLGLTVAKIKVVQVKRGHAVYCILF